MIIHRVHTKIPIKRTRLGLLCVGRLIATDRHFETGRQLLIKRELDLATFVKLTRMVPVGGGGGGGRAQAAQNRIGAHTRETGK